MGEAQGNRFEPDFNRSIKVQSTSGGRRVRHATVDIDNLPIEVHGQQHGAKERRINK